MKSSRVIRIPVIFILAASFILGGCNPPSVPPSDSMVTISVDNGTRETLQIFYNGTFVAKISQYAEISWKTDVTLPQHTITAKDMDGTVIYSTTFYQKDVSRKKMYRVVIPLVTTGAQ